MHLPRYKYVLATFLLSFLGLVLTIYLPVIGISRHLFIRSAPFLSDHLSSLFHLYIIPCNMGSQPPLHEVPGLLRLPTELLDNIFTVFCFCFDCQNTSITNLSSFFRDPNLKYLAELRKLSLTCKRLRDNAQPILFHRARDGLKSKHFVSALRRDSDLVASVKCLSLLCFSIGQGDNCRMAPVFSILNRSRRYYIRTGHSMFYGLSGAESCT